MGLVLWYKGDEAVEGGTAHVERMQDSVPKFDPECSEGKE